MRKGLKQKERRSKECGKGEGKIKINPYPFEKPARGDKNPHKEVARLLRREV
jgi:hypothetical protein